uniref:DNA 3'-5' helicase n=1 Tax=Amphimedon queenslandica TaxID=400682 RepID=A0A1X7TE05_AMPQE
MATAAAPEALYIDDHITACMEEVCLSLGYSELRSQQKDAIKAFVAARDDQVEKFQSLGIRSAYRVGDQSLDSAAFLTGDIKLIFISPESLNRGSLWRDVICSDVYQQNVVAFVIDEAHLVKNWGIKFRPDFSRLSEIRSLLPQKINVLALTATATLTLQKEIMSSLGMVDPVVIEVSPEKHNLHFSIKENATDAIMAVILELKHKRVEMERMIIFCRRPLDCANLWMQFQASLGGDMTEPPGSSMRNPELRLVDYFTGCTEEAVRNTIPKQFSRESCLRIVIATVAFGLGIDCPDVRKVLHFGVPEDVETYVQQVGRAGRDGRMSYYTLLFGSKPVSRFESVVEFIRIILDPRALAAVI